MICKEAGARSSEISELGLKKKLAILRDVLSMMKKEYFKATAHEKASESDEVNIQLAFEEYTYTPRLRVMLL